MYQGAKRPVAAWRAEAAEAFASQKVFHGSSQGVDQVLVRWGRVGRTMLVVESMLARWAEERTCRDGRVVVKGREATWRRRQRSSVSVAVVIEGYLRKTRSMRARSFVFPTTWPSLAREATSSSRRRMADIRTVKGLDEDGGKQAVVAGRGDKNCNSVLFIDFHRHCWAA